MYISRGDDKNTGPDANPEFDRLIHVIEESDSTAVGQIFRAIQDGSDQQKFVEHLQSRISDHDKDIERMCNFHYQGFVDSVGELLEVRAYAETLKKEVLDTNEALQRSGQPVVKQANELQKARKVLLNIAATTEHLQTCLPVLQVYCKLNDQINSKRYYPALKTLEQLEHTYLPRVRRYRFCEKIAQNIPKIRDSIKEASMSDLTDFLESIRKHSDMIGEEAMKQVHERTALEHSAPKRHRSSKSDSSLTEVDKNSLEEKESEEEEDEEEVLAQDKVDFSPVYRCLHIYTVLGEKETFEHYYRRERKKQARLTIIPQGHTYDKVEFYQKYFYQVVGFFVVEDHIYNTTDGLASSEYIDQLWNMALSKINDTLTSNTACCTDATLLLQIKDQIVLFLKTLTSYGFNTTVISDLLVILKDQYNEILMKTWLRIFSQIFDEDNYTAILVHSQEEFEGIVQNFPFKDQDLRKAPYPKELPFSQFVPKVYRQIKEFIYACHKFSLELNLTDTEREDMVRKSTNVLLTRTLSGCLTALIRKHSLGLAEVLVQVIVNTTQLEEACIYLEDFISNITGTQGDNIHAARLQGAGIFRDAGSEAAEEIYNRLDHKVNEFLELSSYDWSMEDSNGKASDYILDIISFLEGSFKAFTNLPQKVAITACMSTCKYLASSLMAFLLDDNLCFISMGALRQFSLDVIQCELFVNSEPVPGFKDGTLQMTFVELRQLLDLFIHWDWSTYLADYNNPKRQYDRVTPQTAIILLEKMRDADKKKNLFTTFKKNERDRKKLMDTVLKQLRALTARPGLGH
ncbi:exocyst complex component 6-like isoform X2 [Apostichopus japonicus]|uniref:exocyst complex component 6-like isoform X2 n=1 Tax=Stichopus japonicus TaxID=307972 RepID=UPI003AB3DD61